MLIPKNSPEISDLIISFDSETLKRQPVQKTAVIEHFTQVKNVRAASLVHKMPAINGILDPVAVNTLLIRVHTELQRLSEEFVQGQRVAELIRPFLQAFRLQKKDISPFRIVDVGCGIGYVLRWLAAKGNLGDDVELIGADYNEALIEEAQRLAHKEQLRVSFIKANAFKLAVPASIYITTGVLHHFKGQGLTDFFQAHERPETLGFAHFDFQPSPLAPLGAWLFHITRFREPLARHDGVLSAIRAHSGKTLLEAVRSGTPDFASTLYNTKLGDSPIPRPFQTLLGIRPVYQEAFVNALKRRASRIQGWK
ncbi:MAG: class I SAM-dependent methyltransferase [Planctomycetota bacterium]